MQLFNGNRDFNDPAVHGFLPDYNEFGDVKAEQPGSDDDNAFPDFNGNPWESSLVRQMMRTRVEQPGATNDEDEASNDNAGDDDGNDVDNDGDGNDGDGDDAEDEVGNDGDVGKPCSSHGAYTRGHHDPKHGFFRDGPELGDVKVEQPASDDDNAHQAKLQDDPIWKHFANWSDEAGEAEDEAGEADNADDKDEADNADEHKVGNGKLARMKKRLTTMRRRLAMKSTRETMLRKRLAMMSERQRGYSKGHVGEDICDRDRWDHDEAFPNDKAGQYDVSHDETAFLTPHSPALPPPSHMVPLTPHPPALPPPSHMVPLRHPFPPVPPLRPLPYPLGPAAPLPHLPPPPAGKYDGIDDSDNDEIVGNKGNKGNKGYKKSKYGDSDGEARVSRQCYTNDSMQRYRQCSHDSPWRNTAAHDGEGDDSNYYDYGPAAPEYSIKSGLIKGCGWYKNGKGEWKRRGTKRRGQGQAEGRGKGKNSRS